MSSLKTMDDDRINALFATITKQEDGSYTQNMLDKLQFWKKEIETLLSQSKGSKLILNTLNLQSRFEINGLTPLCLDEVLRWMIEQKELLDEHDFATSNSLISSIVGWSWGMFFGTNQNDPTTTSRDLDYSQKITSKFGSQDSVLDKGQFDQFCHEFGIDAESDIDVIKKYLVSTKQLYHKTEQGVWACKFGAEVVESDFGILKIKKTMKVLQGIISDMEVEIQKAKAEAKMLVALGLNTRALYNLRVAKKLDHVLQQRLSSLDTLDNLLSKINQSKTQIEIMSAYEVGTKTLKDILKKDELSLENVQDTMDALSDVLEDHEEISNAIANTEDFEEELEIELEAMIQADASTPPTPISASGQLYGSGIIPQQGSPIRLKGSDSKIGTPNMRMKVMAGSGSHLGSTRSSDKESELEARLDQLKMSTTPPAPLKSKKKVAEMLPAE